MSLMSEFLKVASDHVPALMLTAGLPALAVMFCDGLPKKGRALLMGCSLLATVAGTGGAVWNLFPVQQKPICPWAPVPPDVDRGVYIPIVPRVGETPGLL